MAITWPHAGSDDRDDDDQDDEAGEAQPGVDEALHQHVELAADDSRDRMPIEDRDDGGERRRADRPMITDSRAP